MKRLTNSSILLILSLMLSIALINCKNKAKQQVPVDINSASESTIDSLIFAFSEQLKSEPENDELYFQRAKLYVKKERFILASQDMEKAVKYERGIVEYYNLLGDIYYELKNIKGSIDAYEQSKKLNPDGEYAFVRLARIYLLRNEPKIAIGFLNEALRINPNNAETFSFKALYYLQMKDTVRAISNLQSSVEVNPDYFNSYLDLAYLYSLKKDKIALLYFDNALRIEPENVQALYNRGKFYQDIDSFDSAVSDYETILGIIPDHKSANYNLGYIHYLTGQFETAIQFFSTAIIKDPYYGVAYYGRGLCYSKLKNSEMARENFKKALELDPGDELAQDELNKLR